MLQLAEIANKNLTEETNRKRVKALQLMILLLPALNLVCYGKQWWRRIPNPVCYDSAATSTKPGMLWETMMETKAANLVCYWKDLSCNKNYLFREFFIDINKSQCLVAIKCSDYQVLVRSLLSLLHHIALHEACNRMNAVNISKIMAPSILVPEHVSRV